VLSGLADKKEVPVIATEKDEAKAKAKVLSGLAAKKEAPEVPVIATEKDEAKAKAKVLSGLA